MLPESEAQTRSSQRREDQGKSLVSVRASQAKHWLADCETAAASGNAAVRRSFACDQPASIKCYVITLQVRSVGLCRKAITDLNESACLVSYVNHEGRSGPLAKCHSDHRAGNALNRLSLAVSSTPAWVRKHHCLKENVA